ncbi:unnamed protein product [Bursaphelenchus xylophilus]|uniref:(pine wood nematode) hypothetical protein n=1 Tax=Bursaphelenchus xylophilus TaxID=6326 RepID=A0A1I7SW14_BURXY|nr:unnamed protein product [Bursaphelenchus xylophilus]CAG9098650.1 unnamed protein product [Bursaphelenchus xylophilus]
MTIMDNGLLIDQIRSKIENRRVREAYQALRNTVGSESSYWAVKAHIITAQASKQIPLKLVRGLELEMALKYKSAKDVISLADYFYKNHGQDEDFRKICSQKINEAIEAWKGSDFAEKLHNSLNPQIFLDPLSASRDSPLLRMKKLLLLAVNPSMGLKKVGRQIMEQYKSERSSRPTWSPLNLSPVDLIWFYLQHHIVDQRMGELTSKDGAFIVKIMMDCCIADSLGLLRDSFFDVLSELGLTVARPRDFWSAPLRIITILISQEQPNPSEVTKFIEKNIESCSYLQISENLVHHMDTKLDAEICKFLLSYAITMSNVCEGGNLLVVLPGNVRDMSQRGMETYWKSVVGSRSYEPIMTKSALGHIHRQYDDAMAVVRNVFKACQRHNSLPDAQVEPTLRSVLSNPGLKNGFSVIAQSLLTNGDMETASQFIKLAIQTTKDQDEQKRLDIQLLQVYVSLKRYTSAFKLFVDLFEDEAEVTKVLEGSSSIFPDVFLEENHLILLPQDLMYTYIVIMFMHTVFLVLVKHATLDKIKHIAASLILLSLQICYEIFDDKKIRSFLRLCEYLEICFINIASLISKQHLMVHLISSKVTCLQGKDVCATVQAKRKMISNIRLDGNHINKLTPYRNVIVFLKEFRSVFADL